MSLKKLTAIISANKGSILHRALILGGTAAGAVIADGLLSRINEQEPEIIIIKEYENEEPETEENEEHPVVSEQ